MQQPPFNPFENLTFHPDICFLTGKKLADSQKFTVPVFPKWLIERYHLENASLTMLEWNKMKYADMLLPASEEVAKSIEALDTVTQKAFEQGYEAVIELPELTIFQWMARVMYGVLYQDFTYSISRRAAKGSDFQVSRLMEHKLKNLLFMLQSLIRPVVFEGFTPWSMKCYRVNISKDILNYKDETHKLNFCLGMNGFSIAACLQDNGEVAKFNEDVLKAVGDATLHPAQFEELYGRFMYTNYLLRELPDYPMTEKEEGTLVFHLPEHPNKDLPKIATWQDEIFAQVLANMWEPWGIPLKQIYTFPNSPISYLVNEFTHKFIPAKEIKLDY